MPDLSKLGCAHGKTFEQRCIECDIVYHRLLLKTAYDNVARYKAKIAELEKELKQEKPE